MISLILIVVGLAQFIYFGYNILTLLVLMILGIIAGVIAGAPPRKSTKTSDDVALLAQIERNRYYSSYKNKE